MDQDHYKTQIEEAEKYVIWNFGDAEEEAAAIATGSKTKVTKIAKKLDGQRLLYHKLKELVGVIEGNGPDFIAFPFLGHVSSVATTNSLCLGSILGVKFHIHPAANPSPSNPLVLAAWLPGTTNKPTEASVDITPVKISLVTLLIVWSLDFTGMVTLLTVSNVQIQLYIIYICGTTYVTS